MRAMESKSPETLFAELQGEQLSAVTFVQNYLQLWFDGQAIGIGANQSNQSMESTLRASP
jgi:hypothetical protein